MGRVSLVPPRPSPIAAGYRLDRYELICPIAEGGMASVWIARQTGKHGFRKLVAVKTILPKYAAEPKFQRMFIDEARIASRIEHTNVTQILDVGEQHDVTYLVMEYVDGDALSKLHRAAKNKDALIPLGIVLRIMADACAGLHAAHELEDDDGALLGVVHRDVSPQNVLVSTRGVAKVIDFGVAKARDRLSGETHGDTLKGKVQYMPPEQALGLPVDRRADVWAVGAVLYHLITGKPPFEADNEIQTIFMITSGRRPAPLPAEVPACVQDIVHRALSHKAEARYATAAQLQQALEDAIVETRLAGTTSAVAAFVEEIAGDRAEKRKEAIAIGLKAAEDREKVAAIMRSNTETTSAADTPGGELTPATQTEALRRSERVSQAEIATSPTLDSTAIPLPTIHPARGRPLAMLAGVLVIGGAIALMLAMRSKAPVAAASGAPEAIVAAATATATAAVASVSATPSVPVPVASGGGPTDPSASASAPATRTLPSRPPAAVTPSPPAGKPRPTASSHRGNYGF